MVAPALLALALGTLGAIADIPTPHLNASDPAVAGEELLAVCSLPPGASKDIAVALVARGQRGPLNGSCADSHRPPRQCRYRLPEEDEGEVELMCNASLAPNEFRAASKVIALEAKPRLGPASCPAQHNWTEGETEKLDCRAWGRPDPELECTKDGHSLPVETPFLVEQIHAGIYLCRAWNRHGSAERNVTVWVQASSSVPLLPVLLGSLVPVLVLLVLTGLFLARRHRQRVGEYWLWKRQPRPPGGHQGATKATKAAP